MRADEGFVRIVLFAVMAVMFVVAVTIPEAFTDLPGGLSGPVVFAACYLAVRVLHLMLYFNASRVDSGLRRQLLRAAVPMGAGALTLFAAALVPQQLFDDPPRTAAGAAGGGLWKTRCSWGTGSSCLPASRRHAWTARNHVTPCYERLAA